MSLSQQNLYSALIFTFFINAKALRTEFLKREVKRYVLQSKKNQLNPIYSVSSHLLKQIFAQDSSYVISSASTHFELFALHCSTKQ